ncbi:MAG: hypothetical protein M0010_03805 [Actinomycetota bacterium]|nr:hypothetical protein [Actinomycetota bacterium]
MSTPVSSQGGEPTPSASEPLATLAPVPAPAHAPTRGPQPRPSLWRRLRTAPAVLAAGLVLVLIGGFMANTAQTAGGTVRVTPVSFPTATGQMDTGLLYVPATATTKTPAPGVVTIEGYINSVDTMDGFSIEMARRGAVVLDVNQSGQGGSAPPVGATAYGAVPGYDYLSSMSIVRHDDIGFIGHSMGGWASVLAAAANPTGYRSIALISSSVSTPSYEPVPGTPTFPRNVAVIEASNSEFSTLMWGVAKGTEIPTSPRLKAMFGTTKTVVTGHVYGSIAAGTGRVLYIDGAIHPGLTFDPTAIQQAVSWMQRTLVGTTSLPASNQVWLWDEAGTFLALVGALLLAFGVGGSLLRTRFFSSLARKLPESRAARGLSWWGGIAVLMLIGPVTFFWFQTWGQKQFPAGSIFPETITTGIVVWAIGDALIGGFLFLVWHFLGARRRPAGPRLALASALQESAAGDPQGAAGASTLQRAGGYNRQAFASYGVTEPIGPVMDWANLGKAFLLALASVASVYVAVFFFEWAWSSDVRIWVFNIKPITTMYLPVYLSYVWPFFVYFLIVSTVLFGQLRPRSATLGRFMLTVTSVLVVGYIGLIGVEYGASWATGQLATATQPLLAIVGFQFIPVFVIVGTLLSYFFWKTGRIWTGVFVSTLLITGMLIANTALQSPPW